MNNTTNEIYVIDEDVVFTKRQLFKHIVLLKIEIDAKNIDREGSKAYVEATRIENHSNTYLKKWNVKKFSEVKRELVAMVMEQNNTQAQEESKLLQEVNENMDVVENEEISEDKESEETKVIDYENPGYLAAANRTGNRAKIAIEIGLDNVALGIYIVEDGKLFRSGKEIGRKHKATGNIYYDIQDFEIIGQKFMYAYYYGADSIIENDGDVQHVISHINGNKHDNRPGNIVQHPRKGMKQIIKRINDKDRTALEELKAYNPGRCIADIEKMNFNVSN